MIKEEVVKTIDNIIDYLLAYKYQRQENDVEALRIARDLVESQRWIPVSERLPDRQGWGDEDCSHTVQVTIQTIVGIVVRNAYYCFSEKTWYSEGFVLGDVLAWMPLPEPYKAESEEGNADGHES